MTEGIGHNGIGGDQLRAFIERIEKIEAEKKEHGEVVKEIYAEAKASGLDAKIIRKIVAIRKQDADTRQEEQAILELHMESLGMLRDTPLGDAAIERARRSA